MNNEGQVLKSVAFVLIRSSAFQTVSWNKVSSQVPALNSLDGEIFSLPVVSGSS